MTSFLIGLGLAKLPFDVADMAEYVEFGLKKNRPTWQIIAAISLKTMHFLSHVFQVYELTARLKGWHCPYKISVTIRFIGLVTTYINLIESFDQSNIYPKPIKIMTNVFAMVTELLGFLSTYWSSMLSLSDQELAKQVGYRILIQKEWISETQMLSTYQLLTKERVIAFVASITKKSVFTDYTYLYLNYFYWIWKTIFPNRQQELN